MAAERDEFLGTRVVIFKKSIGCCTWPLLLLKILHSLSVLSLVGLNFVHWGPCLIGVSSCDRMKTKKILSLVTLLHSHPRCCLEMNQINVKCYCFRPPSKLLPSDMLSAHSLGVGMTPCVSRDFRSLPELEKRGQEAEFSDLFLTKK